MDQTNGMAMEAVSERPDFSAADSFGSQEKGDSAPATPASKPEATTEQAAPSTAKPEPAKELTDEELANDASEPTENKDTAKETPQSTDAANPSASPWDDIRKEFPDISLEKLRAMRERDKNTTADYTRKTQALAEQRKAFEEQSRKAEERWGALDSAQGDLAMQIIRKIEGNDALHAQLMKAFEEVSVDDSDVRNVALRKQQYEMDKKFKAQEERLQRVESERIEKEASERIARARQLCEKQDIDFDLFYLVMNREVSTKRSNGEEFDVDELMEPVAAKVKAVDEERFNKRLEKWKQSKRTAAKVAPVGARGGSVAPAPKEPDLDTSESREAALLKYLGGA